MKKYMFGDRYVKDEFFKNALFHYQNNGDLKEHPQEFYAVLEIVGFENSRKNFVTWVKDVNSGTAYPINQTALQKILKTCEWQGVGLLDGKWKIEKHGDYVSLYPVE